MPPKGTLIHLLSQNAWGGVTRYALDICRHYMACGWNVAACTRDAKAVDDRFRREGVPLLHAPLGGLSDISSAFVLARMLKEMPPSTVVMHAHGFRNAFTALLARKIAARQDVRIVMTRHKVRPAIDSWLFRRIYRNLDAMVFVSRIAADRFNSTWHGRDLPFDPARQHIIHNSIYLTPSQPDTDADLAHQKHTGPVTAMYHGPLVPGKGLETLIDALSLLKGQRMRLRIVGSGRPDFVDGLRRRAIARGVMDMIDWHKLTDDPLPLIRESDFGVLPSSGEEAFGLANIEYMACGRPQVCSANGAQPEYLTDGREALLIPHSNPPALAAAMRKLAADPDLRQRMGARARDAFDRNLSWSRFTARLNPLYLSVRSDV